MSLPCGLFIMSGGGGLETYSAINMAYAFCSWGSSRLLYRDGSGGDPMKPRKEPEDSQGLTTLLHRVIVKATKPLQHSIHFLKPMTCVSCSVMSNSETPLMAAHQAPSVYGILQARIQKCIAMPFTRGSS